MRRLTGISARRSGLFVVIAVAAMACPRDAKPPSDVVAGPAKIVLAVTGMTCAMCVGKLTKALRDVPGVGFAHVDLAKKVATVLVGREQRVSRAALLAAVKGAGDEYAAAIVEPITYVR